MVRICMRPPNPNITHKLTPPKLTKIQSKHFASLRNITTVMTRTIWLSILGANYGHLGSRPIELSGCRLATLWNWISRGGALLVFELCKKLSYDGVFMISGTKPPRDRESYFILFLQASSLSTLETFYARCEWSLPWKCD